VEGVEERAGDGDGAAGVGAGRGAAGVAFVNIENRTVELNVLGRLAGCYVKLERLEEGQKSCGERIKRLEANWSEGFGNVAAEVSRIGTRQFDTGRRLEIVSESCAAARKEARQARWAAFLLAVVVLGLLCGLAFGKAA
jgi:hypothetical protein